MLILRKRTKTYLTTHLARVVACLSLGSFILALVGLPLPAAVQKDRSVPFPCQDRACGCMSAKDCKEHCCCFDNEQKQAWARQHDVDSTAFVDLDTTSPETVTSSCCKAQSCCGEKICHCDDKNHSQPEPTQVASEEPDGESDFVLAWQARKCQGLGEWWLVLNSLAPPPSLVHWKRPLDICGSVVPVVSLSPLIRTDEPDVPVPISS